MLIRAITKSCSKVIDKYTVYFHDGSCLTMSSNPDSPQGVSQWGEYFGLHDGIWEEAMENNNQLILLGQVEQVINYADLPSIIKSHIEKRISDTEEK